MDGRGGVNLDVEEVLGFLDRKLSTLYEWLREGEKAKVFRFWQIKQGILTIYYSSLVKVCYQRGVEDLGAIAMVPVERIKDLHVVACEVQTLHQQEISRRAALKTLKPIQRKHIRFLSADEILNGVESSRGASAEKQSSLQSPKDSSSNDFVIHRGAEKVFIDRNFVPYGASQQTIAAKLGCSDRTVRNYLQGIERKQLVQTKPEYSVINQALGQGLEQGFIAASENIYLEIYGDDKASLFEPNGLTQSVREGGHQITRGRFFTYMGKTWLYRNNIYSLDFHLRNGYWERQRYGKLIVQNRVAPEKGG